MKYLNKLEGKNILVVGATSGLGFCVAEACVEHGALVTIASSKQSKIDATLTRLKTSYPQFTSNIRGHTCDLSGSDVEAQVVALYNFATNNGENKLDHIANTAGDSIPFVNLEDATYENTNGFSKVRYFGSLFLAKHASTFLHKSHESSLTLTTGVNSTKPWPGFSALIGLDTAKEGMTRALAKDLAPIRVNCISPGAVKTELFAQFGDEAAVEQMVEKFKGQTLTGTIGRPEDVAESYVGCMKNWFLTGQVQQVEGGYILV